VTADVVDPAGNF